MKRTIAGAVPLLLTTLFALTCSKAKIAEYSPVYDASLPSGTGTQAECSGAQDAETIPTVAYTTPLTAFGSTTVENLELGAINDPAVNSGTTTTFRFYAPAASSVELLTYAAASTAIDAPTATTAMTRDTQSGVFYANNAALGTGTFYRYRVNCMKVYLGGSPMKEFQRYIPDPYARAQAGSGGHSIVMSKKDGFAWPMGAGSEGTWFSSNRPKTKDYIVYELHVGDFTGDDSCSSTNCATDGTTSFATLSNNSKRGKYAGLKDMIPYLQKVGVNAVELMPLHEYSVDSGNHEGYSWGYLPVSFFAPESSYASDANNGSAVAELKSLIQALHAAGIAVVLDIVLTHTANYYNYLYFTDPYNRSYFRLSGTSWQSLGTGNWINDDKANRPFAYKLVRDNLLYWVKDFHVDGFRFDLVVGTRKETLQDVQNMLCNPSSGNCAASLLDNEGRTIKPPNFWTGENWLGATRHDWMVQSGTSDASFPNIAFNGTMRDNDYVGFSQWNDYFRESVKGFIQGKSEVATTNRARAAVYFSKSRDDGIWQAVSLNPVDTLNYIESHDEESVAHAVQGNVFKAAAGSFILMTSHGIPMLQQGQEFMRDKGKQDQSQSGNSIKWGQLAANRPFFHFVSYMTQLRRSCPAFRYGSDPTTGNSNFDSAADNQQYSLFTKGAACSGSALAVINGRSEFRVLVNMSSVTKTFTVETGGGRWCALAQVKDRDGSDGTSEADFWLNGISGISGITETNGAGWSYTTSTWAVTPLTAVILTKISGGGNCSTG